jgi:hypothetical protein
MTAPATSIDTIDIEAAQKMRGAILQPLSRQDEEAARALLDRWFDAERRGELRFEPGARDLLVDLRPPRRH